MEDNLKHTGAVHGESRVDGNGRGCQIISSSDSIQNTNGFF